MENKRFRVGSIAVLFAVVILCVAVFGALTVATAAQDLRRSQRYADHVAQQYACENLGHAWLAEQTGAPGETASTTVQTEDMQLEIRIRFEETGTVVERWSCTAKWAGADGWELWEG